MFGSESISSISIGSGSNVCSGSGTATGSGSAIGSGSTIGSGSETLIGSGSGSGSGNFCATAPSVNITLVLSCILSGSSAPRQSIYSASACVSAATVGVYVIVMEQDTVSSIFIGVHVSARVNPSVAFAKRTSVTRTGAFADNCNVAVAVSPTVTFDKSTASGETYNSNAISFSFGITGSASLRVNNNINKITTTTNAAASNNH